MVRSEIKAAELLMDNLNQGIVFVDQDGIIQSCNMMAKEMTGIVIKSLSEHEEGCILPGDIVVIADNEIGGDDGNLTLEDLKQLNIKDGGIQKGDMIVAVGVYQNNKIEPEYKYIRGYQPNVELKLDVTFCGFHVEASIDTSKKQTHIEVNRFKHTLDYHHNTGDIVVVNGASGDLKFFQERGYSTRNEELASLLRGKNYVAKKQDYDKDVTGKAFLELFEDSALTEKMYDVARGTAEPVHNRFYEINKRPFVCDIIPWNTTESGENRGICLVIRNAENLQELIDTRNEIIRQAEKYDVVAGNETGDYPEDAFGGYVGRSRHMKAVKYMAYRASKSKFNVIITGESGTGKSRLAREIHELMNPDAPFVEVNCNAIAPSLFESELFGYVGGSFTGAQKEGKVGFFEAANKGTIFLDEIGEIPLDMQVKLLHVLQNKTLYRVGSSKPVKVDVRVIAATNKNLEEEVARGNFRQDLYYRINVFPIEVPPIREHKDDLYPLINQILKKSCEDYGIETKQISGEAFKKLVSYSWPGNIRELENVIERAITLCESNIIYSEHLHIGKGDVPTTMKEILAKEEARILETTLMKHKGDKQKAMEELDMSRAVFYDKLKKYGITYYKY